MNDEIIENCESKQEFCVAYWTFWIIIYFKLCQKRFKTEDDFNSLSCQAQVFKYKIQDFLYNVWNIMKIQIWN